MLIWVIMTEAHGYLSNVKNNAAGIDIEMMLALSLGYRLQESMNTIEVANKNCHIFSW